MAAEISILGWKVEGFRCPDHEIDFTMTNGNSHPVSLIQMPNGTGKTTTLNLIQASLSGNATEWTSSKIRGFKKQNAHNKSGNFEMRLLLNEKRMTIKMHFDFEQNIANYKMTYGSGQKNIFSPPKEFRKLLSENFVKFYVFDGELAEKLLDHNDTNAEDVIEHLFQIDHIKIIKRAIEKYWDDATVDQAATEERGLNRSKNKLREKEEKLNKLIISRDILLQDKNDISNELVHLQDKYKTEMDRSKEYSDVLKRLQEELRTTEVEERSSSGRVLEKMTDPTNFSTVIAKELHDFKNSLDKVKLPETAAREFFQELAGEQECVCGREITADIKNEILNRAEQYLGSDDVSLLNAIKSTIEDSIGVSESQGEEELRLLIKDLTNLMDAKDEIQDELDTKYLEAENSDPELEKIRERIHDLKLSLGQLEDDLVKYSDPIYSEYNIEPLEKEIEELKVEIIERSKTVSLNKKKTKLHEILDNAYNLARDNISAEICRETNEKIKILMPTNDISIDRIDKSIRLKDRDNGSVGEQLSVAYAFLSTLFQRSDHNLPFIMDSPVGSIDGDIRKEIATLIPKLAKQFLAFTISTERANFLRPLERACNGKIQYFTLFRHGKSEYNKESEHVIETNDGVLIHDKTYFNNFQVEEEE